MKINGLDLFSGIGGISQALAPWVKTIAYCERERYPQAVLVSRMQRGEIDTAPIWDDVTTLKGSMLPSVDIISGGFPCQDISFAGFGRGLEGERSGLFFEIARLVGELGPTFVFLENVAAITSRGGRSVVGALTKLGYDCRWGLLAAGDMGALHVRTRWWLVAHAQGERRSRRGAIKPRSPHQLQGLDKSEFWPRPEKSGICGIDNGIQGGCNRIRCLGNSVVPQCAREAFKRLMGIS